MLNALPESVRSTLCGRDSASAERAIAGPGKKPDEAAQQPCANRAPSDAAHKAAQRRLPARHRQLAALAPPRPRRREALAPPTPPSPQRHHRDPPLAADRLQARAAGQHQRVDHHKQRRHTETPPEEARRRRCHTTPATTTAQAVAPGVASQLRRQTVGLARVGGAVQRRAATQTARRAAPRSLGLVDPFQKGPHTGVGKNGVREKPVRHWRASPGKWQLSRDKLPGGVSCTLPGGRLPSHIIQCEQNPRKSPQKHCAHSVPLCSSSSGSSGHENSRMLPMTCSRRSGVRLRIEFAHDPEHLVMGGIVRAGRHWRAASQSYGGRRYRFWPTAYARRDGAIAGFGNGRVGRTSPPAASQRLSASHSRESRACVDQHIDVVESVVLLVRLDGMTGETLVIPLPAKRRACGAVRPSAPTTIERTGSATLSSRGLRIGLPRVREELHHLRPGPARLRCHHLEGRRHRSIRRRVRRMAAAERGNARSSRRKPRPRNPPSRPGHSAAPR